MFRSISLSLEDYKLLREQLAHWIKNRVEVVKKSPSEKMAFLNIDFLLVNGKNK